MMGFLLERWVIGYLNMSWQILDNFTFDSLESESTWI